MSNPLTHIMGEAADDPHRWSPCPVSLVSRGTSSLVINMKTDPPPPSSKRLKKIGSHLVINMKTDPLPPRPKG